MRNTVLILLSVLLSFSSLANEKNESIEKMNNLECAVIRGEINEAFRGEGRDMFKVFGPIRDNVDEKCKSGDKPMFVIRSLDPVEVCKSVKLIELKQSECSGKVADLMLNAGLHSRSIWEAWELADDYHNKKNSTDKSICIDSSTLPINDSDKNLLKDITKPTHNLKNNRSSAIKE